MCQKNVKNGNVHHGKSWTEIDLTNEHADFFALENGEYCTNCS